MPGDAPSIKGTCMGIPAEQLIASMDALAALEPAFAAAIAQHGYPAPRIRQRGYATLVRTIVGQQVSVKAAEAMANKLDALVGVDDPAAMLAASDERLREAGMSRQKAGYLRSLAQEVSSGQLDLDHLPTDDEEAIAALVRIKGIGRWSAEIYLLFAEGRADIWPAGDLAIQIAIGRMLGLTERPSEKAIREWAEAWRPHRGAAAIFAWHSYGAAADPI